MKRKGTGRVTLRVIPRPPPIQEVTAIATKRQGDDSYEDEYSGTTDVETWSSDEFPRLLEYE